MAMISEKNHSEIVYGLASTFLQPLTHRGPTVANARLPPQLRCRRCLRTARPPHGVVVQLQVGSDSLPFSFFLFSLSLSPSSRSCPIHHSPASPPTPFNPVAAAVTRRRPLALLVLVVGKSFRRVF